MKFLNNISLVKKLIVVFIISILIPSISMGVYSYRLSSDRMMQEIINNERQSVAQIKDAMEVRIATIHNILDSVTHDYKIQRFLQRSFTMNTPSVLDYTDELIPQINYLQSFYREYIDSISIYYANPSIPEIWNVFFNENNIINEAWYSEFQESSDSHIWLYPQKSQLFDIPSESKRLNYFSLVRKIYSQNGDYLGVATSQINEARMLSALANHVETGSSILLLDNNNNKIIFSGDVSEEKKEEIAHRIPTGCSGNFIVDEVLYTHEHIEALNMTIIAISSLEGVLKSSRDTLNNMILVLSIGLLFTIIVSYLMIHAIMSRLKRMMHTLGQITDGRFDVEVPVTGRDEVGELALDINLLIRKINDQIVELVRKESEQKNAQIMALQYQINPHFLYNTLDFFKSRMELNGDYVGAETMSSFAMIFRYNTDTDSIFATINKEIKLVEDYFGIQKIKYGNRLQMDVDVPDDIRRIEIIKFVLQPIVENCFKHGFNGKISDFHISIEGFIKDDALQIRITDNGAGMTKEELAYINEQFRDSSIEDECDNQPPKLGLLNINNRIKLFYGETYHLMVDAEEGEYTSVTVTIPYIKG